MNTVTEKQMKAAAEAVHERWLINEMPQSSKVDKAYLNGMLDALLYLGFEYRIDVDGKPILIR